MVHAQRGHWLERRRTLVVLATLAAPLWLASCTDEGDDDGGTANGAGAGTTSAGAGGGAGVMHVAGASATAGRANASGGRSTAGTSSSAGKGALAGTGATNGGGAGTGAVAGAGATSGGGAGTGAVAGAGATSGGGAGGSAGANGGSAGCAGPEDCMPDEYCVYTEASRGKPICQAEPEVGPAANCCFSCDSFPICTLCWREEDCPRTYICVHSAGQPEDGPGGCRLAE